MRDAGDYIHPSHSRSLLSVLLEAEDIWGPPPSMNAQLRNMMVILGDLARAYRDGTPTVAIRESGNLVTNALRLISTLGADPDDAVRQAFACQRTWLTSNTPSVDSGSTVHPTKGTDA